MADPKRAELTIKNQKAILVAVVLAGSDQKQEKEPLEELRGLAKTGGVQVVGTLVQNRQKADRSTYIGTGKLEELKQLVEMQKADLIIFDSSLSPGQLRNLEEVLHVPIVDRSDVILAIFAEHARTNEAQLQVELAQLLYMRPRLTRMWTHLERTEGAIGSRGPGEQQLETDRRLIDERVDELRQKLKIIEKRRERTVSQRHDHLQVSIVGYTNAGKSTLMNALTGADVYVADQLFATLDTRTRTWSIPHFGKVLLSDTVGFIRDLPHNLVASFRSTLEEARHADVLLHVVDASHPQARQQIKTVNSVLAEIGVDTSSAILVLNKLDAVEDISLLDVLRASATQTVSVSALRRTGFEELTRLVADRLSKGYLEGTLETSVGNGRLFAYLAEHAEISQQQYLDSRVKLHCRIPRRFAYSMPREDTQLSLTPADGEVQPGDATFDQAHAAK